MVHLPDSWLAGATDDELLAETASFLGECLGKTRKYAAAATTMTTTATVTGTIHHRRRRTSVAIASPLLRSGSPSRDRPVGSSSIITDCKPAVSCKRELLRS